MKSKIENFEEDETVVLAARVPTDFKESVAKFGKKSKRKLSNAVHYLVATNPEFLKFLDEEIVERQVS